MSTQIARGLQGLPDGILDAARDLGPCWFCGGRGRGGVLSSCTRLLRRAPHDPATPMEAWTDRRYVVVSRCEDCVAWQQRAQTRVLAVQIAAVVVAATVATLLPVPQIARTLLFLVLGAAALLGGLGLGGVWVQRSFLHPNGRRADAERREHPRVQPLLDAGYVQNDVAHSSRQAGATVFSTAGRMFTETGDLGALLSACDEARGAALAEAGMPIRDAPRA